MSSTTTRGKTEPNRAAIYARVSDKSQDTEDKTTISEQMGEMEAYRGGDVMKAQTLLAVTGVRLSFQKPAEVLYKSRTRAYSTKPILLVT